MLHHVDRPPRLDLERHRQVPADRRSSFLAYFRDDGLDGRVDLALQPPERRPDVLLDVVQAGKGEERGRVVKNRFRLKSHEECQVGDFAASSRRGTEDGLWEWTRSRTPDGERRSSRQLWCGAPSEHPLEEGRSSTARF